MATAVVATLTISELDDAAARARVTDSATTVTVVATRQVVTVLPSGRVTVRTLENAP